MKCTAECYVQDVWLRDDDNNGQRVLDFHDFHHCHETKDQK